MQYKYTCCSALFILSLTAQSLISLIILVHAQMATPPTLKTWTDPLLNAKKKNQTAIHVYINNVHASPTLTLLAVYQASSALLMQDGVSVSLSDDPSPSSPSSSPVLMVMKCANPSSTINSSGSFFISLPFLPQGLRSSSSLSTNPTHRQCTIAAVRSLLLFLFIYFRGYIN